jgi:hypothetical protein
MTSAGKEIDSSAEASAKAGKPVARTTQYFKYALGEILLVVEGILIALSINNWNENRKDRLEEEALLTQLQTEFQSNLAQLNEKVAIRNKMIFASL